MDDTGGIRLHERYFKVQNADIDLEGFLIDWRKKHGMTWGEELSIISQILARNAKYMIREERHGDQDIKGDEAE